MKMKKECNNKEFVFDTDDLKIERKNKMYLSCLLYTSPSPRDTR